MTCVRTFIMLFLLMSGATFLKAQTESEFKTGGKPVFLLFSNVHSSFNKDGNNTAFELTRLYLGYEYKFSKSLTARANIDISDPKAGELQMVAYVKNAFLQYKAKELSARIGMFSTDQFNLIEKQWGYRYIFKTLQDEYGFGPSADLGASLEYLPSKIISFDASILNGEGYKKIQSDSAFKYTCGITLRPFEGLQLRAYADLMKKESTQKTVSFFAGYTYEIFSIGCEYSTQKNNRLIEGHDFSGISVFASLRFAEKFSILTRYDQLWSASQAAGSDPWNNNRDGRMFITGLEYSPVPGIRIAPVYIGWLPSGHNKPFTSTPGLHFEIKI